MSVSKPIAYAEGIAIFGTFAASLALRSQPEFLDATWFAHVFASFLIFCVPVGIAFAGEEVSELAAASWSALAPLTAFPLFAWILGGTATDTALGAMTLTMIYSALVGWMSRRAFGPVGDETYAMMSREGFKRLRVGLALTLLRKVGRRLGR